jgi:hypothetical protein
MLTNRHLETAKPKAKLYRLFDGLAATKMSADNGSKNVCLFLYE